MEIDDLSTRADRVGIRVAGIFLLIVGVLLTIAAFNMNTQVPVESIPLGSTGVDTNAISNFGLMQRQMMWLHTGLAIALAGFVAIVAEAVVGLSND